MFFLTVAEDTALLSWINIFSSNGYLYLKKNEKIHIVLKSVMFQRALKLMIVVFKRHCYQISEDRVCLFKFKCGMYYWRTEFFANVKERHVGLKIAMPTSNWDFYNFTNMTSKSIRN